MVDPGGSIASAKDWIGLGHSHSVRQTRACGSFIDGTEDLGAALRGGAFVVWRAQVLSLCVLFEIVDRIFVR